MLNQNYLKVFANSSGTVTIACGEPNDNPLDQVNVNFITISEDDLITLSEALKDMSNLLYEEANNNG